MPDLKPQILKLFILMPVSAFYVAILPTYGKNGKITAIEAFYPWVDSYKGMTEKYIFHRKDFDDTFAFTTSLIKVTIKA